jgi:GNAT superfamily N-acetyltransferase
MPTIRPAAPRDRQCLIEMRTALQDHAEASNPHIWRLTQSGRARIPEQIDEMLNNPDTHTLIAEHEGTPIGFIHGRVTYRQEYTPTAVGFIDLIYVEENQRRKGIGTVLVGHLTARLKAQGAEEANLGYIASNTQAERFWNSLGLIPVRITANTPLRDLENRLAQQQT